MTKDYAKYTSREARDPKTKKGFLSLVVILVIVVAVVMGASGYYLHHVLSTNQNNGPTFVSRIKAVFSRHKKNTVANKETKPRPATEEPAIHFDFYNELPKMQVAVTESSMTNEKKPVPKPVTPASPPKQQPVPPQPIMPLVTPNQSINQQTKKTETQYLIQLGVFKKLSAASELRISLLLSGLEVNIVKSKEGTEEVYRVEKGPYQNLQEAKAMQKKLQGKGFDAMVRKVEME